MSYDFIRVNTRPNTSVEFWPWPPSVRDSIKTMYEDTGKLLQFTTSYSEDGLVETVFQSWTSVADWLDYNDHYTAIWPVRDLYFHDNGITSERIELNV